MARSQYQIVKNARRGSGWRRTAAASVAVLMALVPWMTLAGESPLSFELDVMPILTARGCNQGACHGKSKGQNGFRLSLLGFDPDFDHASLTQHARGRRVFVAAPERSLLLQKAAGLVPHGGGVRIEGGSDDYRVLERWISEGTTRRRDGEPTLQSIEMTPGILQLQPGESQTLRVIARYSDGGTRDVTGRTSYQSNESAVVGVDREGRMTAGPIPGEAAIMGRYMNLIAICHVSIPIPGVVPPEIYASLPRRNLIDDHVWRKLASLGITPSEPCDDSRFLRRVTLDLIGRLPTPEEIRVFLSDSDPRKREIVIDQLLERPEYADHWANKWADLLRPNPYRVGIKAVLNYDHWIRQKFRDNKPYDQFVRELVTATGSTWHNGATTLFRDRREPDELATLVSQLFLGIRLECAKCHHHPFEKWGQDDFYSFAAYFARVGRKGTGLSPPISGGEEMVLNVKAGSVRHPTTQAEMPPRPLFRLAEGESTADPAIDPNRDLRRQLADWMTDARNPYFAEVIVNRVWADLMGRGIVEPVDDLRATNPPSNPALLEALAADFRNHGYDLKHLLRTITGSHAYGLSSTPNDRNKADVRNYSRHYRVRLRAEVLAEAVADITGVRESYSAMPVGSRANEIWTHRIQSVILDTFGRPNPNQDPPCERQSDTTMTQTLHLMNAPQIHQRVVADDGRAAQLAASDKSPAVVVEELYLSIYGRMPDAEESAFGQRLFQESPNRRQAVEDLMWALLNTPEFLFKD
jgi:hypothetical protein